MHSLVAGRFSRLIAAWSAVLAAIWLLAAPFTVGQGDCVLTAQQPESRAVNATMGLRGTGFGDPVVLSIFHGGDLIDESEFTPDADGSFLFEFTPEEPGEYRVLAVVPETECGDEVQFTVLPASDTAAPISDRPDAGATLLVLLATASATLLFGVIRPWAARRA